ncbi:MAG: S-layer homology domain-containing protein [Oscillospiraceae bacterium]|nr:S-layer homology domain-containing protein [Oscillospiraceae bacterium]
MRTLKKTLALVLVLAMMFSLCITASADFTDAEEITNELAVNTLVALGVIEGMPDGSFDPEGTLTRAQAAKIIAYLDGVGEYAADPAETGFTDVPASHWASGYIAYCVDNGIIDGRGDGTFDPSGKLTGYAWAKMLVAAAKVIPTNDDGEPLVSLTGSAWQINTAKYATQLGLWKGDDTSKADPASRDNACLAGFNWLMADQQARLADNFGMGLEETTAANAYGIEDQTTYYLYDLEDEDAEAVVVYEEVEEPVLTYTATTKLSKVAEDLGLSGSKKVILNGEDLTRATKGDLQDSANGVKVLVYADGKDDDGVALYTSYAIYEYIDVLGKNDVVAAKAATATTDAVPAHIILDGVEVNYETEAYAKDDAIIYNIGTGEDGTIALNVAEAKAVVGKVTSTAATYIRIDGEKYEYAADSKDLTTAGAGAVIDGTYTFYLDSMGYIKAVADAPKAEEVAKNYVYVIGVAAKAAKGDSNDLFEVVAGDAAVAQAQIMDLETGTVSVVNQAVVYDKEATVKGYYYADAKGEATDVPVTEILAENGAVMAIMEYVVLEDGSYVFADAELDTVTLTEKTAKVAAGLFANSATVVNYVEYTVKDGDYSATVTTKTGIANFPKESKTYEGALVTADKNGVVSEITIVKPADEPESTEVNYAIFNAIGETDAKGTKVSFYVAGELVEYYDARVAAEGEELPELAKGTVYDITIDTKGKLAGAEAIEAVNSKLMTVVAIDNTYLLLKSNGDKDYTVYFAKDGFVAYDADANFTATELAVEDTIWVYGATKDGTSWTGADLFIVDNAD